MRNAQRITKSNLGSAPFTKWRKAGMLRVSQDQYKNRKTTLHRPQNLVDARSLYLVFPWGFSGCSNLPFLEVQRMPRFPKNIRYLAIFLLVSSRQNFLSFSFLHFLCIFSEDDATFGKDISRPNRSFFRFHSRK